MTDLNIVDYGKQHSQENGHAQLGRTNETGLYPEWFGDRLLHLLGLSFVWSIEHACTPPY